MKQYLCTLATIVALFAFVPVSANAADAITIDECPVPLALTRGGVFAEFVPPDAESKHTMEVALAGVNRKLDAMFISKDASMWLVVVHQVGFVSIPDPVWDAMKQKLREGGAKPIGDALALEDVEVLDQDDRLVISFVGWAESADGFLKASMAETMDNSTGCMVRLSLRSDDPKVARTLGTMMADLTISRLN